MRREHALVLACACTSILLFSVSFSRVNISPFNFANDPSARNEAAIDSVLQQAAVAALANREGTIVIMDAHTGRVRAIVNPPAAYAEALMPGSAIKPFTALAALRAGLIDENSRTVCPGRFTGLGFSLPCVHPDHLPPFNPSQALAYSCNYYFATLGQRLGRDRLITTLREFDFGQRSGISDREAAGVLRPCETGTSARIMPGVEADHVSAQADCNAREAVGESDNLQVTPVQLLSAYTALINGGHLYEPKIAGAIGFQPVERARINVASQHRTIITEGMAGAIRYGTARSAKLDTLPLTIIGKTGTATQAKGFRTNGWFIGFAGPFASNRELDPEQVDLAVLVLLARAHGSQAAEIARPVFEAYAREIGEGEGPRGISENHYQESESNVTASARRGSNSPVRVHLVSGNTTKELSLEDYVLGVMRAEGTMETEPESLKALAIAIRTFALKNAGRHAKDGYDFCSTTHCQRFVDPGSSPAASERLLLAAVQATEGQVLLDDHGQLIDAYFGASCGGETADIGTLWGITPPDYLRGVRDEYCEAGPHARWTDTISRADLLRALQSDSRTDVGNRLDQLIISKRDETGRAEFIALEGEHRKRVRGWDFKIIVGRVLSWNVLKSSRFEVSRSGTNFVFRGSGFGHGLGLCQEGAHVMAARGSSYQKILEKYFPRTRVMSRRGNLSLAQPFKAGTNGEHHHRVPSATNDSPSLQSSLTRPSGWYADVFPALESVCQNSNSISDLNVAAFRVGSGDFVDHSFWRRKEDGPRNHPNLRELNTQTRFLTISSDHFRVTYPADVERRDADQVLKTLESARSDYLRRASASVPINIPTLDIRLNESTGDFTARTGQPWWAAAATKGNRIELQPLGILKQRGVLFSTLRHELAHVTIDSVSHNHPPRWLAEGFAIYLAGEGEMISRYLKRGLLSNEDLEKRLERPSSPEEMRSLYAQAYVSVAGRVRSEGEAGLWKQLAAN
jgi:SpoIID/LytB domain protein